MLLRISDFNDEWTAAGLDRLRREFRLRELAVNPGIFPELPLCTLLTYHSAIERYFLVEGLAYEAKTGAR